MRLAARTIRAAQAIRDKALLFGKNTLGGR